MNIYIGADHRGYSLKASLKKFLEKNGHDIFDVGNLRFDPKDDYPDFAKKVAKKVAQDKNSKGIVMCASGAGVCIVANRVRGIRAVLAHDILLARSSRKDDDTNVLCIGSDFVRFTQAKKIISAWLNTPFEKIPNKSATFLVCPSMSESVFATPSFAFGLGFALT